MPDPIPARRIIGIGEVRKLTRAKYASDLIRWRKSHGFPEPIRVLKHTKSGPNPVELWDSDDVRAWLRTQGRPIGRL